MAVKLTDVFGLILPAGVIIFSVSYIVGDVLTEVYGFHADRAPGRQPIEAGLAVCRHPQPVRRVIDSSLPAGLEDPVDLG
jgi:hypothetical protein